MEENIIVVDELEEAKFIVQYLKDRYGIKVDVDTIMLVTEAQLKYMEKIGLIEEYEG